MADWARWCSASPDEDRYMIELLPALPSAWPNGHIKGLHARGGLEIDQVWAAGKLTSATIRSLKGATCKVRYGNTTIDLILKTGQTVRLDAALKRQPGD
jgi:alpha-L-fucosidase 2